MPDPLCSTCPLWQELPDIEFSTAHLLHHPDTSLGLCHVMPGETRNKVTEASGWCPLHPDSPIHVVTKHTVTAWHGNTAEAWEDHKEIVVV